MIEVAALLAAFLEATGREAVIWERREDGSPMLLGTSSASFAAATEAGVGAWDAIAWAQSQGLHAQLVTTSESVAWLFVEAGHSPDADRLLARLVPQVRRLTRERDGATGELVERYEEISLLYAIGELLGGTTSVENVADTLLRELAVTVGATRAVFLQNNRTTGMLSPIATLGLDDVEYPSLALDQMGHIAVTAYSSAGAITDEGAAARAADPVLTVRGGALMAVAITRPSTGVGITGTHQIPIRRGNAVEPRTPVPLGVLVLGGRANGQPFSAGDRKLAVAVGTQIGTAMHNASLVRAAVERQQLVREMQLAHDLQLKLLPKPAVVGPEARAAARLVPAESVGGDFFLLARLDRHRTGVLIGDVSGHGYQSALVMALALSAAAIHVQAAFDPSIALDAVRRSLDDELSSTEMSITMCYAVIDTRAGEVRFANAGHPHAFRVGADGQCVRLAAVVPPIGFSDAPIEECVMSWRRGDRLVLFTDGITDARDARDQRLGEGAVLDMLATMTHGESPETMLEGLFAQVESHTRRTALRDDLAAVIVDRPFEERS
ncbi:PP2C family protein-serine/threonine phosphatase [Gemmatimonas sp.]|uniref:PP2C family protein-serine/threonine phosphatase n=1 Tax=Gemmatimonas sp. TaxID=1962908 RepID=UPI003983879C